MLEWRSDLSQNFLKYLTLDLTWFRVEPELIKVIDFGSDKIIRYSGYFIMDLFKNETEMNTLEWINLDQINSGTNIRVNLSYNFVTQICFGLIWFSYLNIGL